MFSAEPSETCRHADRRIASSKPFCTASLLARAEFDIEPGYFARGGAIVSSVRRPRAYADVESAVRIDISA